MLDKCQSKFTCREEGYWKRYNTLSHRSKVIRNCQKETEGNIHSQCSNKNKFASFNLLQSF